MSSVSPLVYSHTELWLTLTGLLVVGELFTGTFYLLVLGAAALSAALWAAVGASFLAQFVVFEMVALLLVSSRIARHLRALLEQRKERKCDAIGERVTVVKSETCCLRVRYHDTDRPARVSAFEHPKVGAQLEIVRIDGETLVCRQVAGAEAG